MGEGGRESMVGRMCEKFYAGDESEGVTDDETGESTLQDDATGLGSEW